MGTPERKFAESLVMEVKRHPIIYVVDHPDYKDRFKVDLEWTLIAAKLNSTVDVVKRRWQNLRGSFSKVLAALKNQPSGSSGKPARSFYLFEQMSFLQQHMVHSSTNGSYVSVGQSQQQDEDEHPVAKWEVTNEEDASPQLTSSPPSPTPSASSVAASTSSAAPRARKRPRQEQRQPWEDPAVQFPDSRTSREESDLNFFRGILPMVTRLNQMNKLKFFGEVIKLLLDHLEPQDSQNLVRNVSIE